MRSDKRNDVMAACLTCFLFCVVLKTKNKKLKTTNSKTDFKSFEKLRRFTCLVRVFSGGNS